jgi:hypothetical protein
MIKARKKWGLGSISIVLVLLGILWGIRFRSGLCIGDFIVNSIGLQAWSNGGATGTRTHLALFYSLPFFISAFLLGNKYNNDFGANLGKTVSFAVGAMLIVIFILFAATSVL